jgi:DNA polymerase-3 subunit epsilon
VAGASIDSSEVAELVGRAALVVAHNAQFDRRFCERLFPILAEKPWTCSFREVGWAGDGFESARFRRLRAPTVSFSMAIVRSTIARPR